MAEGNFRSAEGEITANPVESTFHESLVIPGYTAEETVTEIQPEAISTPEAAPVVTAEAEIIPQKEIIPEAVLSEGNKIPIEELEATAHRKDFSPDEVIGLQEKMFRE